MSLLTEQEIETILQKQEQIRRKLNNSKVLSTLTLLELGQQLSILDSERGTFVETWLQLHGYTKISARMKRGDHIRNGEYVEVKARFLSEKERKSVATMGGQVRLWQDLSYYLFSVFCTANTGKVTSVEIYIPFCEKTSKSSVSRINRNQFEKTS
jgi:hypothetical protein